MFCMENKNSEIRNIEKNKKKDKFLKNIDFYI